MQVLPLDSTVGDNFLLPLEQLSELSCDMNSQPSKTEFRVQLAPKTYLEAPERQISKSYSIHSVSRMRIARVQERRRQRYPAGIHGGYLSNLASTCHGRPAQCRTYGKEMKLGIKATATLPFLIRQRGPSPEFSSRPPPVMGDVISHPFKCIWKNWNLLGTGM